MQRIERYGVIALVFLLVTILAVAVWGQRKNQSLLSFLKRDKPAEPAIVDPQVEAPAAAGGLSLADPTHVVNPAGGLTAPAGGAIDPLLPAPAGPGLSAVTFGAPAAQPGVAPAPSLQGPAAQAGSGFVGGGLAGPAIQDPPAPAPALAGERTYKVKAGDTLGSIAKRELGSTKRWTEIAAINNVQPERLKVGMQLKLPAGGAAAAPDVLVRNEAAPASAPKSGKSYNVRPGDSLSKIASVQLGSANRHGEILAMNPGLDPARLRPGQTLRMPADARTASSATKPKPRPASREPEVARADASGSSRKARVQ
jgi:nucleoid-associated protein YgaU